MPRDPMPEHLVPMLARLSKLPPDDERWGFEIKWDGVRAVGYADEDGGVRLEDLLAAPTMADYFGVDLGPHGNPPIFSP